MIPVTDLLALDADLRAEQENRKRNHTSIHLTDADLTWLDKLAQLYGTNRSAIVRLIIARTRERGDAILNAAERVAVGELPNVVRTEVADAVTSVVGGWLTR